VREEVEAEEERQRREIEGRQDEVRPAGLVTLIVLATVIASSAFASAAEITRTSYREAVEPICKSDTQANERILAGVKTEVRAGKLKPAAAQFAKAAGALKSAIGQLQNVPAPAADAARLSKWLGKVSGETLPSHFERRATSKRSRRSSAPATRRAPSTW
jgi:hypothetical protein